MMTAFETRGNRTSSFRNPALTDDQIRRLAPSVFADSPWRKMSDRYKFVPTIAVVDLLRGAGFRPVTAMQGNSRVEGKADFTKHLIRFRHADLIGGAVAVGDEFPELVLTNSHDGTTAYKFAAGVFRVACLNGLVVASETIGDVSLKHSGGSDFDQRVIDVTYEIMDQAPRTMGAIQAWRQIETSREERLAFAEAAVELRDSEAVIRPEQMLATRRMEDRGADGRTIRPDTWTLANVVQEHLIRGGIAAQNPETGRRAATREVKSVGENLRLNKAVWKLTEAFARLKGA